MEAAFDVQESGGGPAGDLVSLESPAGDLGGLGAVVAHDVLNRIGGQERDVEGGRDVELVQGDELIAGLGETGGGGRIERAQEGLQSGERFATSGRTLRQTQSSPQPCRLSVIALAQVAEEVALFVNDTALDESGGPKREHRRLQGRRAIEDGQQAAPTGGPKPRPCKRATNAVQTAAFSLAPTSKSKMTFSPVLSRPKATTTTAPSPKNTPSSMSPKKTIFRRSRSRSSVILAAVASIQYREAADLLIAPSWAHSWLRVLIPAANAVTTAAALLPGLRMAA